MPAINPIDPKILPILDPDFVAYYNQTLATKLATHQVSIDEVRNNPHAWGQPWLKDFTGHERVKNREIPSKDGYMVKLRVYHPHKSFEGPYGVHVNFHGGGFMFGDLQSDSVWCMLASQEVGIVVVDVDYRLCPEHAFGKNIEDAWAALEWVSTHGKDLNINPASISIGGISAGGHFACVLQHMARDASPRIPLVLAMPAVPPIDDHTVFSKASDSAYPSFLQMSLAPMLNWERIRYFTKHMWVANKHTDVEPWLISPIKAANFKGLCDTFLITAECDPIRDEGEAYGMKLLAAGNKVTFRRYLGVPHPFMNIIALSQAMMYDEDTCAALRVAHAAMIKPSQT